MLVLTFLTLNKPTGQTKSVKASLYNFDPIFKTKKIFNSILTCSVIVGLTTKQMKKHKLNFVHEDFNFHS